MLDFNSQHSTKCKNLALLELANAATTPAPSHESMVLDPPAYQEATSGAQGVH